ncbi:MAG TPA: Na+/H+ antiporter subunit B [Pelomicrobium sp.]|nr:Na+/H+ antiporter subunit B [Pelomicrobium sp.]
MSTLILRAATRVLTSLILLFSVYLLLRGHNLPGGGFIGALVASIAFGLYVFAFGAEACRRALRIEPGALAVAGLAVALGAGLLAGLAEEPFLTGLWGSLGDTKVGTPLLFDVGVYLAVVGAVMTLVLDLAE